MQTALNALKSPSVGWVTTTFCAANTAHPLTGTSEVLASTVPFESMGVDDAESDVEESDAVPEPPEPQAARTGRASPAVAAVVVKRRRETECPVVGSFIFPP